MAYDALVTNPAWDWPTVGQYLFAPSILRAVGLTLQLTVLGIVVGFVLGTVLALMSLSPNPLLRSVSWSYIWIFRSVPLILQLLFWYNLALLYRAISFGIPFGPAFFQVETMDLVSPLTAAVLGLALHQAAYAAEVVRSGFLAVDAGQLEAAAALGIPRLRQFRRIQLPQAMRTILPTAGNELIGLVKGTSVVYITALSELFYQVQVIYTRTGRVIPMLLVAEAEALLERVGLADKAGEYPRRLSGGQQQRVAIARALALRPKLVLFDEPTSALDPELVGEVLDVIRDLARTGTTMIIVTHEIGFAREVADTVVFLDGGVIVEQGPPEQVLDAPREPRTRAFLGKVLQ